MTDMYTITVSIVGADPETSLRPDLESTLESVGRGLADQVEPGRTVRWEVRCPSGRTAVGSLAVNAAGSDGEAEIAAHIELVRDVLVEEVRNESIRA